jgi:phosphate:Na+ symporter
MELEREMILAQEMFEEAVGLINKYNEAKRRRIVYMELVVDHLRREIVSYLWKISCQGLSEVPSKRLFAYTAMVDDIERIADHAQNIADMAKNKSERNILFTESGEQELADIHIKVSQNITDALQLIGKYDMSRARTIQAREDAVDEAVKNAREQHLIRFHRRICQAEAGPVFVEILIQLERISDHCDNIAEYVLDLGNAPP